MPKLWTTTIETHRREVHTAILETTAALVGEHGLRGVTMAQIAEETGIGRATLYKYFPDVEAILDAWHHVHVEQHLAELERVRDEIVDPVERLRCVLERYAREVPGSPCSASTPRDFSVVSVTSKPTLTAGGRRRRGTRPCAPG